LKDQETELDAQEQDFHIKKGNWNQLQHDLNFAIRLQNEFIQEKERLMNQQRQQAANSGEQMTQPPPPHAPPHAVRASSTILSNMSDSEEIDSAEVPDGFLCPITQSIMNVPVILVESGHTYEKDAIEQWLKDHDTDPTTGQKLTAKTLVVNYAIKKNIADWKQKR
jgi:hypothetical protein